MNNYKIIIFLILLMIFFHPSVLASEDPPNLCGVCDACAGICDSFGCSSNECIDCLNDPPPLGCDGSGIPIDGGLIWLILGGVGVGAKSIISRRRKKDKGEHP